MRCKYLQNNYKEVIMRRPSKNIAQTGLPPIPKKKTAPWVLSLTVCASIKEIFFDWYTNTTQSREHKSTLPSSKCSGWRGPCEAWGPRWIPHASDTRCRCLPSLGSRQRSALVPPGVRGLQVQTTTCQKIYNERNATST